MQNFIIPAVNSLQLQAAAAAIAKTQILSGGINAASAGYPKPDTPVAISALGTPIMDNLQITPGSYAALNANGDIQQYHYDGITFNTVLFVVTQQKKMIRTEILGSSGTVKEYIADGDYEIKITGILPGANGVYPVLQVTGLKAILDSNAALAISSNFLIRLGVCNIVVDSYTFPQLPGEYSQQSFQILAYSDKPIEFLLVPQTSTIPTPEFSPGAAGTFQVIGG